jgi:general secretion pathway protein G
MLKKKKNNKGFTLVELLVVIAIIGILAVVALPTLFKNIDKAKVADLESDISAIKSATTSYVADKNELPATSTDKAAIIENLDGNLENVSDPYDATYAMSSNTTNGTVTLTVTLRQALSTTASEKITKDLSGMAEQGSSAKPIIDTNKKVITVVLVKDAAGLGVTQE